MIINLRTILIVSAVAAVIAALITWGVMLQWADGHYRPTIDKLNGQLVTCQGEKAAAGGQISAQNDVIAGFRAQEETRRLAAAKAKLEADQAAKGLEQQAQEVLAERSDNPDVCAAASKALDAELSKERQK